MLIKYCLVHFHYILDLIASNVSPQKPYRSIRFRLLGFLVQGKKKRAPENKIFFSPHANKLFQEWKGLSVLFEDLWPINHLLEKW